MNADEAIARNRQEALDEAVNALFASFSQRPPNRRVREDADAYPRFVAELESRAERIRDLIELSRRPVPRAPA